MPPGQSTAKRACAVEVSRIRSENHGKQWRAVSGADGVPLMAVNPGGLAI
jgi:hypothetical protein